MWLVSREWAFFGRMQIIVLSTIDQKENQKLE